jgi:hypothetical protein
MDLQDMGLVQRMTLSLCFSLALGFNITCLELVKKHPVAKNIICEGKRGTWVCENMGYAFKVAIF